MWCSCTIYLFIYFKEDMVTLYSFVLPIADEKQTWNKAEFFSFPVNHFIPVYSWLLAKCLRPKS